MGLGCALCMEHMGKKGWSYPFLLCHSSCALADCAVNALVTAICEDILEGKVTAV